ncbi:erg26, C-3 sterol dehydrogenase, partial [Cladochytrium tenue]
AFFITNDNPIFFWAIPKLLWFHLGLTSTLHYSLPLGLALSLAWLAELYVLAVRLLLGRQLDITFTVFRIRVFGKNRYYDISKAKRLLGYKPILTLEQGIKQLAVWYLERDPKPWK